MLCCTESYLRLLLVEVVLLNPCPAFACSWNTCPIFRSEIIAEQTHPSFDFFVKYFLVLVFGQISPDLQLQLQQPGLLGDEGEGAQTPLSEKIGKRLQIKLIFLTPSSFYFLGRQTCSDYLVVLLDIFLTRLIEEGGIQILLTLLLSGTGNLENNPRPVKESSVRMRQLGLEVGELLSQLD